MSKSKKYPHRSRETLNQMKQTLHNLRMRWPCGIRSVDDEADRKMKEIESELVWHETKESLND